MKEALAQVRRDLGGSAVILGTREVRRRRLFGLGTRELIEVTLQHTNGNKTRAAELLGISLKTLHNKLNRAKDDENAMPA